MIFLTSSAKQFAPTFKDQLGNYTLQQFNDGELFLKLERPLQKKQCITVITATNPPATNLLELFFLLDTLKQEQARIHLIFTYFGYERQDHPKPLVAQGAQVISNCLSQFNIERTTIIHPHSERLHDYISFTGYVPFKLYKPIIEKEKIDVIIAPDKGAAKNCKLLAQKYGCTVGFIEKKRTGIDTVQILANDFDAFGKRILIWDDIISTGSTIIQASKLLKKNGAEAIYAAATHNFLNEQNLEKILASQIDHLWVSNTIQTDLQAKSLTVLNIASELKKLV